MEIMKIIERKALDGKTYKFSVDEPYHTEGCHDTKAIFKGFEDCKGCVLYTEVKADNGTRVVERFSIPRLEEYNNGLVGYQQGMFFKSVEEAEHDYKLRKRLVPKVGTIAYCDVFLVINN